jgi:hypothetical protein
VFTSRPTSLLASIQYNQQNYLVLIVFYYYLLYVSTLFLVIFRWYTYLNNWIFKPHILIEHVSLVGSEVPTAVVLKITIFWDISQCSPYMNRCFGGTYHLHLQGRKSAEQETSESRWLSRRSCPSECLPHTPVFWNRSLHTSTRLWVPTGSPTKPGEREWRANGDWATPIPPTLWSL